MSDPFATGLDEDPAADFLAREQQELAGLEDDGFGGLAADAPAVTESKQEVSTVIGDDLDFFGGDLMSGTTQEPVQDFLGDDDLEVCMKTVITDVGPTEDVLATTVPDAAAAAAPVDEFLIGTATEDNSLAAFSPAEAASTTTADADASLVEEFELLDPLAVSSSGPFLDANGSDSATAGFHEVNGVDSPPESVAPTEKTLLWREEQLKKIAEKDKNEEVKLEEWRNTAKRELEEWYARQAEQVEKHKKNNRVAEAEFVKERDETTPGNEWERISRLCDFNPKNNKNTKDVSKLRSLLLQLKQNPVNRSATS